MVLDPSFRVCRVRYISNSNFAAAAGHAAQSRFAQGVAMCQTWTCVRPSSRQVAGPPNILPQTPAGPCSISNAFAPGPGRSDEPRDMRPGLCSVRVKVLLTKSQSAGPGASNALAARLELAGARPVVRAQVLKRRCCGVRRLSLRATGPA